MIVLSRRKVKKVEGVLAQRAAEESDDVIKTNVGNKPDYYQSLILKTCTKEADEKFGVYEISANLRFRVRSTTVDITTKLQNELLNLIREAVALPASQGPIRVVSARLVERAEHDLPCDGFR